MSTMASHQSAAADEGTRAGWARCFLGQERLPRPQRRPHQGAWASHSRHRLLRHTLYRSLSTEGYTLSLGEPHQRLAYCASLHS